MIFYIKLKKLKKLNKRSFSSFTLLELVLVIVVIGILAFSLPILVPNNNLQLAADNLIKNIYFARSLALKDDKYQPFPLHSCDGSDEGKRECNRSKYWFKQWWQVRFTQNRNDPKDLWYEVFSDQPYHLDGQNFDRKGVNPTSVWDISFAKNPLNNKYLIGRCGGSYPDCNKVDEKLNLTKKYGIKEVLFDGKRVVWNRPKRLMFDNFGNVFLSEGRASDGGDINPLDYDNRQLLTHLLKIRLCFDVDCAKLSKDRCIQINVTPNGFVYKSECK